MRLDRRKFLGTSLVLGAELLGPHVAWAAEWKPIEAAARGQTVYFNAWAGSETINAYIAWAGEELAGRYGVRLEHVKIADAAEVVRRVRDEVKAGQMHGSVDLGINGENFRAMKADRLLFGPFALDLPNYRFVDIEGKPTTLVDFAEATEGLESPWGMAQLTFFGDGAKIAAPPMSMKELIEFANANPGGDTGAGPPWHDLREAGPDRNNRERRYLQPCPSRVRAQTFPGQRSRRFIPAVAKGKQFPHSKRKEADAADGELLMALTQS
jgi:putative thiamine transport system substrate-binding protein